MLCTQHAQIAPSICFVALLTSAPSVSARETSADCWKRPNVQNAKDVFKKLGIPMQGRRADHRWVEAYITAKTKGKAITKKAATELRVLLAKAGHGVMNPSSRGAGTINQRILKALQCFGLDTPAKRRLRLPKATPRPPPPPPPKRRYHRTCGDPVCAGYRGPFPDVGRCRTEKLGEACKTLGHRCDLGNGCNMFLVCAEKDPATECAR